MSPLQPAGFSALQVIQQNRLVFARQQEEATGVTGLLAAANGAEPVDAGVSERIDAGKMYGVISTDPTKLKVHLMEQVGKELGLVLDDFESASAFGKAMKEIIQAMKLGEGWEIRFVEIAHKTGLADLGISLEDFVDGIIDPNSRAGEKLEALLREATGEDEAGNSLLDDIGRYGQ